MRKQTTVRLLSQRCLSTEQQERSALSVKNENVDQNLLEIILNQLRTVRNSE